MLEQENDNLQHADASEENINSSNNGHEIDMHEDAEAVHQLADSEVETNLVLDEIKTVDEIDFKIKRYQQNGYIFKEIDFEDKGVKYHFTEKVRAFTLQDFEQLMDQAGIFLLDTFGDYKLKKFHRVESERLIMIFK